MEDILVYSSPIFFLAIIFFYMIRNCKFVNIINVYIEKINGYKNTFLFVIEWILSTVLILLILRYLSLWWDHKQISLLSLLFVIILGYTFCIYFYCLFNKFKDSIDLQFVLFMIPMGLVFLFLMFPDFVPDEQSHFQRAYLISGLNFKTITDVYIDSDYSIQKIHSYSDIFKHIYININPTFTLHREAANYNFVVYLIPAFVIGIGRILHLSVYVCYYLGRMANLAFFIYIVWYSIKKTPRCKWLFFVFCFNPMMLQLAASLSTDSCILAICILSIAYFMYLYDKNKIDNKDIIIVCSMIIFVILVKYVYLPIFGIYFCMIPKLMHLKKKQVKLILGFGFICVIFLLLSNYLKRDMTTSAAFQEYYTVANVNSSEQIKFLLSGKLNVLRVLYHTLQVHSEFYINSMVTCLGWLTIEIPDFSFHLFYITLLIASLSDSSMFKFKNRIWFIFIIVIDVSLIIIGLHLFWTTVGSFVTAGVQGRYFLPLLLLLGVSISNNCLKKYNKGIKMFAPLILLVYVPSICSIVQYFLNM